MPNRARFQPGNFPKAGYSQNWVERRKKMSKVSHGAARSPRQARNFSFWHLFSPSQGWNWLFSEGKMGQKSPKEGSWPPFLPEKSPKPRGKTFPDPTGSRNITRENLVFPIGMPSKGGGNCRQLWGCFKGFFRPYLGSFCVQFRRLQPGAARSPHISAIPKVQRSKARLPWGGVKQCAYIGISAIPAAPPQGGGGIQLAFQVHEVVLSKAPDSPPRGGGGSNAQFVETSTPRPKARSPRGGGIPTRFSRQVPCTHKGSQPTLLKKGRKMEDFVWSGSRFLLKIV